MPDWLLSTLAHAAPASEGTWAWITREFPRLFTELDAFLLEMAQAVGGWTYAVLFAIVFAETGLVVTPFLPGDSLLFAAGALCAVPELELSLPLMACLLFVAAVLGDAVNYHIGRWIGPPAFSGRLRLLNPAHLDRTRAFFERHGGKAVVLARFVPIVRTFAPFVAGVGTMTYRRFAFYNVLGALVWIGLFMLAGWGFGNLPWVKRNFSKVILGIIVLSVMPIVWEWWRHRTQARSTRAEAKAS
jgi:membrane-associated protein